MPLSKKAALEKNWTRRLPGRLGRWLRGEKEPEMERLQQVSVPAKALVLFARQFVVLHRAGVPLVQTLSTLTVQDEFPDLGLIIFEVTRRIEAGHRLSEALARFPGVFSRIFVVMVQIGEKSGALDDSMDRLADWLQRDSELMLRIRSALTYPAFIMILTFSLTMGLFYGVMPAFMNIFEEMHVQLPLITRLVIAFTHAVRSPLVWVVTITIVSLAVRQLRRSWEDDEGRLTLYRLASCIPLLGSILWNGSASRFCCAIESLLMTGSNLQSSLRLSGAVSGSPILAQDTQRLSQAIADGIQISDYMHQYPEIYSKTMTHMAAAGEESSRLPEMFGRASEFHGLELESRVDALKAALEPIMLAAVAVIVGTIIFSIFLPLYGFLNQIG